MNEPAMATSRGRAASVEQRYSWNGTDEQGRPQQGEMAAASERVVRSALRRQGIRPERVALVRPGRGRRIGEKDIALFTRQLATMLRAGIPLLQAFDIVSRGQTNPRLRSLIAGLKSDIESGDSMSASFARHPELFDRLYCSLLRAGETGGVLDSLLDRLATYREKTLQLKSRVRSALMYPASVMLIATVVMAIILVWVVPAFEDIFRSFGAELPLATQLVIGLSSVVSTLAPLLLLGLVGGGLLAVRQYRRSERLRARLDHLALRLPVFGRLLEKAALARWCRTLATLLGAGVTLVESLEPVAGASGNAAFSEATQDIKRDVAAGISLSAAMAKTRRFPVMIQQMVAVGEESGALESMLARAADTCEQEVDETVARLSTLLEPAIMVLLGLIIGGLVVSMYLPIFQLGSVVG